MRVRYTRTAVRQIDAALEHLKGEAPQAALGLYSSVFCLSSRFYKRTPTAGA